MNSLMYQRKKLELNKKYKISRLTNEKKIDNRCKDGPKNPFWANLIAHRKYYMIFDVGGVKECFMYADPHVRIERYK